MKNTILKFGVLYGLSLLVGFIASYLVLGDSPDNYSRSEVVGYTIMLLSSVAVIYGIKDYKENYNGGTLTFGKGIVIGSAISAIAGLFFGLYMMFYLIWLNPTFTETYMDYSEQKIRQSGASEEVIQAQLQELQAYSDFMNNDFLQSSVMFATVFMIGLLVTIISSAAMRTTQHSQNMEQN
ncbi:DUF4199 domain-containing protein [Alteromonadaceae bacterium M269]|nr:DUF4199 domain-containing protein [Alteromonadaceae bacterium M269]